MTLTCVWTCTQFNCFIATRLTHQILRCIATSIALKNDLDMNFFVDISYSGTGVENYKAVSMGQSCKTESRK
jgi:hypothetical protein